MARVAEEHIKYLKSLNGISVGRNKRGFLTVYSGGSEQSNVTSEFRERDIISRTFGMDFYDQVSKEGGFDALAVDGTISGAFNEEGAFGIQMNLGTSEDAESVTIEEIQAAEDEGRGIGEADVAPTSLDVIDSVVQSIVDPVSTGTSTGTDTGGQGSSSTGGSEASALPSLSPIPLSTGTDSSLQQQIQVTGQQAYQQQQLKNQELDNLVSQATTDPGDISDVLSQLFSGSFGNYDLGLGDSFKQLNRLRTAGKGTQGTKVFDKTSTEGSLNQPKLSG